MLACAISALRTIRTARSTRSLRSSSGPRASSRAANARAKLDRLEALLKPTATNVPRDVALIAELLGVPADGRYPALAVSPQQKREMTLTALLDQLDGVAAQGPVLIVFEDVHWIDPTSQDLLDRMVARVADLPVLLVVTVRPELQPTWVGAAACDDAALEPPWPSRQRRHHCRRHQGQGAARRRRRADPCAHRWRAAVHRGADEHAARERTVA